MSLPKPEPSPQPPDDQGNSSWCICGKCRPMDNPNENVCCRESCCVTTLAYFETGVLHTTVLSIVNCSEIFVDPEYTPASCRKAGCFGSMGTLEEVIVILYLHAWSGQYAIGILPQITDTWVIRNTDYRIAGNF